MSEKREEIEGKLSAAAQEAHEWELLMESSAWRRFVAFMQMQQKAREVAVMLTPVNSEHSSFAQEFLKGEYAGIGLALSLPQTQYELADMQRRTLTKELEAEDATEKEMDTRSSGGRRIDDPDAFGE